MKLIDIKPIILENDADEFAAHVLPTDRTKLLALLRNKREAIQQYLRTIQSTLNDDEGQPETHQQIVERLLRTKQLEKAQDEVHKKILRLEKEEAAERLATIKQSNVPITPQVPLSQIPEKIHVGKRKFNNPYFQSTRNQYAGDPRQFNWTPQMAKMYANLNHMLTSRGLNGFTLIYACTLLRSQADLSNFAVIGADGNVVWRKYSTGYAGDKNVVYVDGVEHRASDMIQYETSDPTKLDTMLAPFKATS